MKVFKNKLIYIISMVIIVIGVICTALWRFNYGINYADGKRITIYIGKEYNMDDIKQLIKDNLGNQAGIYQEVETFKDTVSVRVKEITDEQVDALNAAVKEKYELTDETVVSYSGVPHERLKDIVKPYIFPLAICTIAVWFVMAVALFAVKAENIVLKLIMAFANLVLAEAVYVSIFAITRIPVNEFFIIGILAVYILTIVCSFKVDVEIGKDKKSKKK